MFKVIFSRILRNEKWELVQKKKFEKLILFFIFIFVNMSIPHSHPHFSCKWTIENKEGNNFWGHNEDYLFFSLHYKMLYLGKL